jgi:hypothetical protein
MLDRLIDVSSRMARTPPSKERYEDAPLLFADDEAYTTQQLQQPYESPSEVLSTVPSPDEFRQTVGSNDVFNRDLQQVLPSTMPPAPTMQQQTTVTSSETQSWKYMNMDSTQLLIVATALCTGCLLLSFVVSMMSPKASTGSRMLL